MSSSKKLLVILVCICASAIIAITVLIERTIALQKMINYEDVATQAPVDEREIGFDYVNTYVLNSYPKSGTIQYNYVCLQLQDRNGYYKENFEKVNATLRAIFDDWLTDKTDWISLAKTEVIFQSDEYLTLQYQIPYCEGNKPEMFFSLFYTVNIHTGERVMLDDILDVDLKFAKCLNDNKAVGVFCNATIEENLFFLEEVCLTESEYIKENDVDNDSSLLYWLRNKPDFYLYQGQIVFKWHGIGANDIGIAVSEIREFLTDDTLDLGVAEWVISPP